MRFQDFFLLGSDLQFSKDVGLKPQVLFFLTTVAGWMNRQQQRVAVPDCKRHPQAYGYNNYGELSTLTT